MSPMKARCVHRRTRSARCRSRRRRSLARARTRHEPAKSDARESIVVDSDDLHFDSDGPNVANSKIGYWWESPFVQTNEKRRSDASHSMDGWGSSGTDSRRESGAHRVRQRLLGWTGCAGDLRGGRQSSGERGCCDALGVGRRGARGKRRRESGLGERRSSGTTTGIHHRRRRDDVHLDGDRHAGSRRCEEGAGREDPDGPSLQDGSCPGRRARSALVDRRRRRGRQGRYREGRDGVRKGRHRVRRHPHGDERCVDAAARRSRAGGACRSRRQGQGALGRLAEGQRQREDRQQGKGDTAREAHRAPPDLLPSRSRRSPSR